MDFYLGGKSSSGNVVRLHTLPAYRWLVHSAVQFGFYPYDAEPWHWEYNPPAPGASELEVLLAESLEAEVSCWAEVVNRPSYRAHNCDCDPLSN